ncbi:methyltransferase family protein [Jannaschia ovalis]|uniref:Methyltransferase n=1 Tax=Jannaschia ovalis TaxID=3038773 RepID=A0ABY8LE23_9RHOB|nr:methyltransferase [Jannaschia sp. GRR-S6-38]WGH78872.1 methyltransferase [Jannaschia sp. GRR-S6-38]
MSVRDFPDIPPVWAAGCFAAQFALSLLPGPAPRAAPLGWALIAAGLVLIAWSAWWFWRKSTSIEPREVPRRLIVEGPFRLNRNPIYTGMALALAGTGVLLQSLLAVLLVLPFLLVITRRFVLGEEAALRAAFGPEAEAYLNRTRRW